jgi:hypothetical protein
MVKLDVDMLPTVPDAPPEAGPDRALDPAPPDADPPATPLPGAGCPACGDVAVGEAAVGGEDVARPTETAITAHTSAATTIHLPMRFDSNRLTRALCACSARVTDADRCGDGVGGGGGAAAALSDLPATGGSDVALDAGWAGTVSWGFVGSRSFMVALR